MTSKCLSGVLIVALSLALATPTRADTLNRDSHDIEIGIGVAAAAVVTVVILAIHYSTKKRSVTGCVSSGVSGMSITDEKNKQTYPLSGNMADIKPGDRMKLQGKKLKSKGADKALVWEVKDVTKDFGVCQPQL